MDIIIQSTLKTLSKAQDILDILSDEQLSNTSISPYYSSIGSHIRHILDFYDCILNVGDDAHIDLTARTRNREVEICCLKATAYLVDIEKRLKSVDFDFDERVYVIDDLGLGKIKMSYTMAAAFSQANSHTIHHYAIISYILEGLNVAVSNIDFGYNPTTPKQIPLNQ